MRKTLTPLHVFLFFVAPLVSATGQTTEKNEAVFVQQKDSVYLVNQSIFIDAKKIHDQDLFKKLEQAMDKKVLNQFIPLASGTGFLVNKGGYIMTAFHVVKHLPADKKMDYAQFAFMDYCGKYLLPGCLTAMDFRHVMNEYKQLVKDSDIVVSVKSSKSREYLAQVIGQDDTLDLALLKIEPDEELSPFAVSDNTSLKVGDSVVTIGYPLQFMMDKFLDDFKPTVTDGIISAIRNDKWDIQHTAAINSGNSGGPLLTKKGIVIGINVGTIRNANDLYFAINSSKVIAWLAKIGKGDLIQVVKGDNQ
jgi:S1-C subfamily serine protease